MKQLLLTLLFAVPSSSILFGGVVFEIETTDHEQSPPKSESIQAAVEGQHLKMGIASKGKGSQGEMIYNADRKEMIFKDGDQAYKINEKFFERLNVQSYQPPPGFMQQQLAEAMKNIPADQQARVRALLGNMPGSPYAPPTIPETEIRKTSRTGKANGYSYRVYEVWRGGRKVEELHVTSWDQIPYGDVAKIVFEDMGDFFEKMQNSVMGGKSNQFADNNMFTYFKQVNGFITGGKNFEDNSSFQLISAKERTFPPGYFEVKGPVRDMGAEMGSLQGNMFKSMQGPNPYAGSSIREGYPRNPSGGGVQENKTTERAGAASASAIAKEKN